MSALHCSKEPGVDVKGEHVPGDLRVDVGEPCAGPAAGTVKDRGR